MTGMKKVVNTFLISLGAVASISVLLIIVFIFLSSINERTGKAIAGNTKTIKGTITGIACHNGINDISFTVKGADRSFYINRGMEKGLDCSTLRSKLIDKEVEISYVNLWLYPKGGNKHVNRLSLNNQIIYTELTD